ncbi:MAG TPA: cyclic nucleotide-binding domain-containing protein [Myxococcales bacterium]|nr:cyclic nucleotide-binding domain-containing protein [Myxococcales bacterium]
MTTHLRLIKNDTVTREISAVRRALVGERPADPERIWEADELGAVLLDAAAGPASSARARVRLPRPRLAPPAWRLHRRRFEALLAETTPFDALSDALRAELAQVASWVPVPAGGTLFRASEPLEHVHVVAQGRFDISRKEISLGQAGPGSAFGLSSALGAPGAAATVTTRLGGSALRLPFAVIEDAALCEPAFRSTLVALGEIRRLACFLAGTVFADLCGPAGRSGIAALFTRKRLERGEPLVREGEVRNGFALVESGRLGLWMRAGAGAGERLLGLANPGQALGLVASLRGRPCSGSLRALEPTRLSMLDHDAFRTLLLWNPSLQGLPALLASRGQLAAGSFFGATGALPALRPTWLGLAPAVKVA